MISFISRRFAVVTLIFGLVTANVYAQRDRIGQIDRSKSVMLRGAVPSRATQLADRGPVDESTPVTGMSLHLKLSAAQQTALDQLLAEQQNPASPNFHKWLTPEQFADRFGSSQSDIDKVTAWLKGEGFTVDVVARGRTWIQFSGSAGQVNSTFRTELHRYQVNGVMHYANSTEPSIPAALSRVVSTIRGLNDFHPKPHLSKASPDIISQGVRAIGADDFAAIYDLGPLYAAGIDGTGQKIAVIGQTRINTSDIDSFRTNMGLATINLQLVKVPRSSVALNLGDLPEADLDIEWASAVARNATVLYVYSADVFTSAQYAIDQNLAPVITMSYGFCEGLDYIDLPSLQASARQGNAQGITWLNASGDAGAADCDGNSGTIAQAGLWVDIPSQIPEVTGVGGTEFSSGSGLGTSGKASGYIPESAWNDSSLRFGFAAGGGGASAYFPKPVWQAGPGVPNDGRRDTPDVSMLASPQKDPYYVFTSGGIDFYGGTSCAAPTLAGIVVLLNQYLASTGGASGVGNINPALYRLAQNTTGVFHDITTGSNSVSCAAGSPDCVNGFVGFSAGPGYDQATGLGSIDAANFVHQWSSQPAVNSAVVPSIDQNPVFQLLSADQNGNKWAFNLTFTEEAGVGTTLTDLTIDGVSFKSQIASLFGSATIPANGSISGLVGLSTVAVPKDVVFTFSGTDAGTGRQWTEQMTVPFKGLQVPMTVAGICNAASCQQAFAPGMIMSVYGGGQIAFNVQAATAFPLPTFLSGAYAYVRPQGGSLADSVAAPLYYVSPGFMNIQIPYEISPGPATLEIDSPYELATYDFVVASAAPGIFMTSDGYVNPSKSGSRGQQVFLYITGEGQVSPSLATGETPTAGTPLPFLPQPVQDVEMTVGGVAVEKPFKFIGIPSGLAGVTQINFVIPATAPLGPQPVVVTVGGVPSNSAMINVLP